MDQRSFYKPLWRINKSILPLGIDWEDFLPSLIGYLFLQIFLDDVVVPLLIAISVLVINATLKRTHRSKAFFDKIIRAMNGDHHHVEKN